MSKIWICEECGSNKVQQMMWVEINTNEVVSEGPGDKEDNWCPQCEDHTVIKQIIVKKSKSTTKNK